MCLSTLVYTSAAIAQLINSSDGNNEANCASAAAVVGQRVGVCCVNSYSRLAECQ